MSLFTPVSGLIGGSLIGISACTLLLFNGDIMGASGIASSLILDTRNTVKSSINQWKIAYLASVLLTTKFYLLYFTNHALIDPSLGFNLNVPKVSALGHIISGFLVGFGTKLGNGCTTGHGICGLARFSLRSLVGVVTFMATGVFAGTMCSPTCPLAKFLRSDKESIQYALPNTTSILVGSAVTATFVAMTISILLLRNIQKFDEKEKSNGAKKIWPAIVSGSIFALGLAISGMAFSSKIYGFLDISGMVRGTYDPTLITVMGGGFIWSWLSYQFVPGWNVLRNPFTLPCPLSQMKGQGEFNVPSSNIIDKHLVLGEAIFGLGWGIGGLCPGPAILNAAAGYPLVIYHWWPSFFFGAIIANIVKKRKKKQEEKFCRVDT